MMKVLIPAILMLLVTACNSPVKQHNKEIEHKANKLQNVQSGPLDGQKDTSGSAADTPAGSVGK
jgi:hypothetical protein